MTPNKKPRVAVVVQRYGLEISGGAELFTRLLAEHLNEYVDVDVLTTCAKEYLTWENYFEEGETCVNDVAVYRFKVEGSKDFSRFDKKSQIFFEKHSFKEAVDWLWEQGPISSGFLDYIELNKTNYDVFIFMNFEYATTYLGVQLVSERAILIPAAHDHPFTFLPMFRPIFNLPAGIAYLTNEERRLVNLASNNNAVFHDTIGIGVDIPDDVSANRFCQKYSLAKGFILYVGRIELGKNVNELFAYYLDYIKQYPDAPPFVVIGKIGDAKIPEHPKIIHLGRVSEQDKFDALEAADVLVMPSLYESLSMVLLEAWLVGTPVLVNGLCEVTKDQVISSNGGLYYFSFDEFCLMLTTLLQDETVNKVLGRQGKEFTKSTYDWHVVMVKYLKMIKKIMEQTGENLSLPA